MTFEPERMPADNMLFIDPHIHIMAMAGLAFPSIQRSAPLSSTARSPAMLEWKARLMGRLQANWRAVSI
ncbi:MAG: hypothetical protein M3120_00535 [Pseudomonadota bacterium]|nr:hypothetical protein [Pseudomonadota bacterium]